MNPVMLHTFGCRSPKSKGVGKWDGAFVYCEGSNGYFLWIFPVTKKVAGMFENGMDFIYDGSKGDTYEYSVKEYYKLISEGYIPMTPEDISQTAGLRIDNTTKLTVV